MDIEKIKDTILSNLRGGKYRHTRHRLARLDASGTKCFCFAGVIADTLVTLYPEKYGWDPVPTYSDIPEQDRELWFAMREETNYMHEQVAELPQPVLSLLNIDNDFMCNCMVANDSINDRMHRSFEQLADKLEAEWEESNED